MKHDSLWKGLLSAFFPEFLELVLPAALLQKLDLSQYAFIEQEAFVDLPRGRQVRFDLLSKIASRSGQPRLVLVHVEIERQFKSDTDARIWRYFNFLQLSYDSPAIPIVLFLRGGPPNVEKRSHSVVIHGHEISRFQYWAFGLSRAKAEQYLGRSALSPALAACMGSDLWRAGEQKFRCMEAILQLDVDEAQRLLLIEAVNTYLDLAGVEDLEYAERVEREPLGMEVKAMEMTWSQKIEARSRLAVLRETAEMLLTERFGALPSAARRRLESVTEADQLSDICRRLVKADSLEELGLAS